MLKETIYKTLDGLRPLYGTPAYDVAIEEIYQQYKDNEEARSYMADYITEGVAASGRRIEQIALRMQLQEIAEVVNLSYIARHYFRKTKAWLYQRLNANIVNGKASRFTQQEVETFNRALKEIGNKIGSVSVHLH